MCQWLVIMAVIDSFDTLRIGIRTHIVEFGLEIEIFYTKGGKSFKSQLKVLFIAPLPVSGQYFVQGEFIQHKLTVKHIVISHNDTQVEPH